MSQLSDIVNAAGTSTSSGGGAALDFNAKQDIAKSYEPGIEAVKARIVKALALPMLSIEPNFSANFATIDAYVQSGQASTMYPREWKKALGRNTLDYFNKWAEKVEELGFGKDEMLQEGYKDVADKNEVVLRVVGTLKKGTYNETVIENGVTCLQTTPEYWTTNMRDVGGNLMDLL